MKNLIDHIRPLENELIALRREFHRIPETAKEEHKTAALIAEKLRSWGIETRTGVGGTGVVAIVRGGETGKTLAIRADIDALPVTEETGFDFASAHPGRMHACGHDGHIAIGLGTVKALSALRDSLRGTAVVFFQPAEETVGGAEGMIADGVLDDPKADAVVGLHIWPEFNLGLLGVRPGPVMASVDKFEIDMIGKGGHGAMPHLCVDPVPIASETVLAFQRIISREVNPLDSAVITVGKIEGGTTFNVIPEKVTLTGTVRTLDRDVRSFLRRRMEETCTGIAAASRGTCRFGFESGVPPTVNDAALADRVATVLGKAFGEDKMLKEFRPSMGGEDFALYQEKVPGVYFFLGTRNAAKNCVYPLHHPKYGFDEAVLPLGVRAFCEIALDFLG
jgi:amidohydrolase